MRRSRGVWAWMLAGAVVACPAVGGAASAQSGSPAKKVVRTQDDLPRHSYPVTGTAAALLGADDATFNAWAARVDADVIATLAGYDIQDRATLRDLLSTHLAYQMLTGEDAGAMATMLRIRSLQDKPDAKLTSGLKIEAMLKARAETKAMSGAAYEAAFARHYAALLKPLPWPVVGTALKEARGNAQIVGRTTVEGYILQQIEPIVARDHRVSDKPAGELIWARSILRHDVPVAQPVVAALTPIIRANSAPKADIWAAREVTLTSADKTTPVVAAVWDSGTDLSLFPGQVYTDPAPRKGAPYHAHGLAYDIDSKPTTGWLLPLTPAQSAEFKTMIADFQGFADLQQAIDSPAADALKAKLAAMPATEQPAYFEKLALYRDYGHGTHVAGIMARGNPAIRLASARMTYDWRNIPAPPTDASVALNATSWRETVAWFRAHKVRVVNMSWSDSPDWHESALEKNGIGKDAAERKALARRYFEVGKAALYEAIKSAPEVLFVCSAGNTNGDNGFEESIPSGFELPNLLTVSAVDSGGDEASFTTYGKNVVVSANGYQVDSVIPGGAHIQESGTSMASPNVANLAAKLIALDPTLTPAETIALIRKGATASADGRRNNIDPKASVALLKAR
ncbi:S8 family serine peptidase [Sphingomonas sp. Y38-1Y]|uniref:S8 family serine peptidase n=1 Tax=Sphingomonas sp. Y38-1Y TaxID=3078265 RepID=UPI0028E4FE0D|nr:S8 family serine peptidase [Sphingomonas sp. Y38-1Y]